MHGTQAGCVYSCGNPASALCEEYDGTSWTEGNNLNAAKSNLSGAGIATAGIAFGGNPALATTEEYDGTSWTEVADLSTGRHTLAGAGTQSKAIAFGGATPTPAVAATEEWDKSAAAVTMTSS